MGSRTWPAGALAVTRGVASSGRMARIEREVPARQNYLATLSVLDAEWQGHGPSGTTQNAEKGRPEGYS